MLHLGFTPIENKLENADVNITRFIFKTSSTREHRKKTPFRLTVTNINYSSEVVEKLV